MVVPSPHLHSPPGYISCETGTSQRSLAEPAMLGVAWPQSSPLRPWEATTCWAFSTNLRGQEQIKAD